MTGVQTCALPILSPPEENSLQFVRVTADGGIDVYKAYREPIAMPGMMGS